MDQNNQTNSNAILGWGVVGIVSLSAMVLLVFLFMNNSGGGIF